MATKFQDIIDKAAAKVFGEGVSPPIHPGDIKWTWERVNPADPDSAELHRFELGRKISAVPAGEQQPSVEPREVPGTDYARAPVQHQWGDFADRCQRCGLTRELVEDFAPDCGHAVDVRDAVIAAMCRGLAKQGNLVRREDSMQQANDILRNSYQAAIARESGLEKALQRMTESYELSCVARDQLKSQVRILEEDNARLKTEIDRHPWARRMVR